MPAYAATRSASSSGGTSRRAAASMATTMDSSDMGLAPYCGGVARTSGQGLQAADCWPGRRGSFLGARPIRRPEVVFGDALVGVADLEDEPIGVREARNLKAKGQAGVGRAHGDRQRREADSIPDRGKDAGDQRGEVEPLEFGRALRGRRGDDDVTGARHEV